MGSPDTEAGRNAFGSNEVQHPVTLTHGFYLSVYPITRGQFKTFVRETNYTTQAEREQGALVWKDGKLERNPDYDWRTPGFDQTDDHPVVCITWDDCFAFCNWLGIRDSGTKYRLPTEAEWEYAARAGTKTPYWQGETIAPNQSNHNRMLDSAYHVGTSCVDTFPPNAWGLYDINGNALVWCQDWYGGYATEEIADPTGPADGHARVVRGASWDSKPDCCRSAQRGSLKPMYPLNYVGFRICFRPD